MRVVLYPYQPVWKNWFEQEKKLIHRRINHPNSMIVHIGSTAVEGMVAKAVVDIMMHIPVHFARKVGIPALEELGYTYFPEHEKIIKERLFFKKRLKNGRAYNLHVVKAGSNFWKRHLIFRNYLCANKEARMVYAKFKIELATKEWKSSNDYAQAKTPLIRDLEREAVLWNALKKGR